MKTANKRITRNTPVLTATEARVLEVVRSVPKGQVITFAELAELADLGSGRGPGIAGRVVRNAAKVAMAGRTGVAAPPWWRVVSSGRSTPLVQLLPGPAARTKVQRHLLRAEVGEQQLAAPLKARGEKLPRFLAKHYIDHEVSPAEGHRHTCTLIYLHGFGEKGQRYRRQGRKLPWVEGRDGEASSASKRLYDGLRVVLPTARRLEQPWGEIKPAWYAYSTKVENRVGDVESLESSRVRIAQLLRVEIKRLGGAASRVFLGGVSQGCVVGLDVYMREASTLGLGGFVGVAGYLPSDSNGFEGADAALTSLLGSHAPIWLMCPTDDQKYIPWKLAKSSLQRARGKFPGFVERKVNGRGHNVGDWEGEFLGEFLQTAVQPSKASNKR